MRALVVYESLYGNTHTVAERIGDGLRQVATEVQVASVHDVTRAEVLAADLLVVGGPTHVHGMASERTRLAAKESAEKPGSTLRLEPDTEGPCLREWFLGAGALSGKRGAAFDTRMRGPALLTGRASRGIASRLDDRGCVVVRAPESFLVDKASCLVDGEAERAEAWGRSFADVLVMGA